MLGDRGQRGLPADEMRLRRLAIQIVSQLPNDVDQAIMALDFARELVGQFLTPPKAERSVKPPIALVKT